MSDMQIGLQLYTLRDLTKADFAGTMVEVKKIGYDFVEVAGWGNLSSSKEVKKALDKAGLKSCGLHASLKDLRTKLQIVLDDCETLETNVLVLPFMPENQRTDAAAWKNAATLLDQIGDSAHQRGIDFAYHNHSFEFQKFDGKYGLDILYENSTPHLLRAEIDVYWVQHGGEDPAGYQKKLGERVVSLHLKDMAEGEEKRFAPVGTGILDFRAILDVAKANGTRWGIVEQDQCYDTPPLEAIKISRENLRTLGY